MKKIAVISGPNLNLLGTREPQLYGSETMDELNAGLQQLGVKLQLSLSFFQSNVEGLLVDYIQAQRGKVDALVVNAAAYTHTSIAMRDALIAVGLPFVEVHLTNVDRREGFRQVSMLSDIAVGSIQGFGPLGYELALRALKQNLRATTARECTAP